MENTGKVLVCREQVKNLLFGTPRLLAVWGYECYPLLRLGLRATSGFTPALWYCGLCISQKSIGVALVSFQTAVESLLRMANRDRILKHKNCDHNVIPDRVNVEVQCLMSSRRTKCLGLLVSV